MDEWLISLITQGGAVGVLFVVYWLERSDRKESQAQALLSIKAMTDMAASLRELTTALTLRKR